MRGVGSVGTGRGQGGLEAESQSVLAKGKGEEVCCVVARSVVLYTWWEGTPAVVAYSWEGQATDIVARLLSPIPGATRSDQDSDFLCSSSVGDSVSLTTTAFVTSISGCCCLASCIAMARAWCWSTSSSPVIMIRFSILVSE